MSSNEDTYYIFWGSLRFKYKGTAFTKTWNSGYSSDSSNSPCNDFHSQERILRSENLTGPRRLLKYIFSSFKFTSSPRGDQRTIHVVKSMCLINSLAQSQHICRSSWFYLFVRNLFQSIVKISIAPYIYWTLCIFNPLVFLLVVSQALAKIHCCSPLMSLVEYVSILQRIWWVKYSVSSL